MKIHKAGVNVIISFFIIEAIVLVAVHFIFKNDLMSQIIAIVALCLFVFVVRFFRDPQREINFNNNQLIVPADGKVVVIEEIEDKEYTKEKRVQISIFMSVWNVHVNWMPLSGKVLSVDHINGKFLLAKQPKSSTDNERSVTIIESDHDKAKIVVKQIAGTVARRIITYFKGGDIGTKGQELGFIRFGSRVDVLLPLNYDVKVELGQKVVGCKTILAEVIES